MCVHEISLCLLAGIGLRFLFWYVEESKIKEEEDSFKEKNEREVGERENNASCGKRRTVTVLGKNIYMWALRLLS